MTAAVVRVRSIVWTSMLAALVAVGAYVKIPLGPIPFSMQPFFVLLAGFVLGPGKGALCLGLYLAAGAIGLPVFAGGGAGFASLFGPTGGFLFAFPLCAALAGMATRSEGGRPAPGWKTGVLWGLAGLLTLYLVGVVWLKVYLSVGLGKAFLVGMLPFFPGDLIKLGLAVSLCRFLNKNHLISM